jgi:hypothetical protein
MGISNINLKKSPKGKEEIVSIKLNQSIDSSPSWKFFRKDTAKGRQKVTFLDFLR